MPDLLLELFSEEIPARMQRKAAGDLKKLVTDALVDAGLTYEGAREYWTPRRLTLDLRGLTARSADIREERKGPRTDAPEQAITGFLRGAGLESIDQAQVRSDPRKGDFYVAVIEKPGREAKDIIAGVMPGIIRDFPWPKSMRWGEASREAGSLRWVRPLHSILCTFGPETEEPEVVPFEVGGIAASNETRGHRFLSPAAFTVKRTVSLAPTSHVASTTGAATVSAHASPEPPKPPDPTSSDFVATSSRTLPSEVAMPVTPTVNTWSHGDGAVTVQRKRPSVSGVGGSGRFGFGTSGSGARAPGSMRGIVNVPSATSANPSWR